MLQEVNPEQLAAAQHGDGALLIVAGAGTGRNVVRSPANPMTPGVAALPSPKQEA